MEEISTENYRKWRTKEIHNYEDMKLERHELKKDLIKRKVFFLDRIESIIRYDQAKKDIEKRCLRVYLADYWDKLPKHAYRKAKELENLTIEVIGAAASISYENLNGKHIRSIVLGDLTKKERESLMNPIKELLLDEFLIIKTEADKEIDRHKQNIAAFFQFHVKYKLISDFKALETLKYHQYIIGLDIRNGSRFKVKDSDSLLKLLDLKEYFIFGLEV